MEGEDRSEERGKEVLTPRQLCQKIAAGKYKGGISATVLREDAKKALKA